MEYEFFQTKNFKEGSDREDIATSIKVVSYGEMSSYQTQPNYCRNHLVMPKISRKGLPMQDSVGGDNNRTPVIFQVPDGYLQDCWSYIENRKP